MADLSYSTTPTAGTTNNASDVITPLNEIKAYVNGSGWVDSSRIANGTVTADKLAANAVGDSTEGAAAGLNGASTVRRGKSIIATEESTSSTSYTYLTTPDRVQNVVLPTDGLIFVLYRAMMKHSVQDDGRAAIFLGSDQLKVQVGGSNRGPVTQAAVSSTGAYYTPVVSTPHGLLCPNSDAAYSSDVTTGQSIALAIDGNTAGEGIDTELNGSKRTLGDSSAYLLSGGVCAIHAAAGTYTITVKYKTVGAGAVYAKDRKLWVWTMAF